MSATTRTTPPGTTTASGEPTPQGFLGRSTRRWLLLAAGLVLAGLLEALGVEVDVAGVRHVVRLSLRAPL